MDILAGITASPGESIAGTTSPAPLGPGTETTPLLKAKPLFLKNALKKSLFGDFAYSRLSEKLGNCWASGLIGEPIGFLSSPLLLNPFRALVLISAGVVCAFFKVYCNSLVCFGIRFLTKS